MLNSGSGFQLDVSIVADEDGSYYHAVASPGYNGGQHIWLRERYPLSGGNNAGGGGSQMGDNINIEGATYIVVKFRTNAASKSMKFLVSTTGWNSAQAVAENPNAEGRNSVAKAVSFTAKNANEWTTCAINLKTVLGKYFAEDTRGGYFLDTMYLEVGGYTPDTYLDIAYIAFVDNLDEARELCDTEVFITD